MTVLPAPERPRTASTSPWRSAMVTLLRIVRAGLSQPAPARTERSVIANKTGGAPAFTRAFRRPARRGAPAAWNSLEAEVSRAEVGPEERVGHPVDVFANSEDLGFLVEEGPRRVGVDSIEQPCEGCVTLLHVARDLQDLHRVEEGRRRLPAEIGLDPARRAPGGNDRAGRVHEAMALGAAAHAPALAMGEIVVFNRNRLGIEADGTPHLDQHRADVVEVGVVAGQVAELHLGAVITAILEELPRPLRIEGVVLAGDEHRPIALELEI